MATENGLGVDKNKKDAHNQYMRYWRAVQKPDKIGSDLFAKVKTGNPELNTGVLSP